MNKDNTYRQLVTKMREVSALTPQTMGSLTPLYKLVIPFIKRSTWRPLLLGSVVFTVFVYILLGASIVWIVSVLQRGF